MSSTESHATSSSYGLANTSIFLARETLAAIAGVLPIAEYSFRVCLGHGDIAAQLTRPKQLYWIGDLRQVFGRLAIVERRVVPIAK